MRFCQNLINPRAARPSRFQPRYQLFNLLRLTAGQYLDAAVIHILRISRKPKLKRLALRAVAKANSLYEAVNPGNSADR